MSKRWNIRSLIMALVVAGIALAGCSHDSTPPVTPPGDQSGVNLNDQNGGLSGSDEAPAFGDQTVQDQVAQEKQVEDAMSQDPEVRRLLSQPNATMYVMTVLWGRLSADRSAVGPGEDGSLYDWSGTMSLNHGAILVRSLISFEKDDSVLPRAQREVLSWVSGTDRGFDGLRVVIFPAVSGTPTDDMLLTLDFPAMGFHRELTVSELGRISEIATVDSTGNMVSISAFLVPPTANSLGFIRGGWEPISPASERGSFSGVWVGQQGRLSGTLRGVYGLNQVGDRVLFGKFIDNTGRFAGFLRGTWMQTSGTEQPVVKGTFTGRWIDPQNRERGTVKGTWQRPADGSGTFEGSWCVNCPLGNG